MTKMLASIATHFEEMLCAVLFAIMAIIAFANVKLRKEGDLVEDVLSVIDKGSRGMQNLATGGLHCMLCRYIRIEDDRTCLKKWAVDGLQIINIDRASS